MRWCHPLGGSALPSLVLAVAVAVAIASAPALSQHYDVRSYTEVDGLPSTMVLSIGQDPDGRIWFVTRTTVVLHDGSDWEEARTEDGELLRGFTFVRFDERGEPWLIADNGAARFRAGGRWPAIPPAVNRGVLGIRTASLVQTGDGTRLAVAPMNGGLFVWDGAAWRGYGVEDGLPSATVHSLEPDGDTLLIGTGAGLARYTARGIRRVPPEEVRLPPGPVLGLAFDREPGPAYGRLWVQGTTWLGFVESGELRVISEHEPISLDKPEDMVHLVPDGDRGVYRGGRISLHYVDADDGRELRLGRSNGFIGDGLRELFRDRDRNVWIATDVGASRLDSLRFASFDSRSGLLADEVSAILERRSGELVFGHNAGLTFFDGSGIRTLRLAPENLEPGRTRVMELAEDASGTLWIAASNLGLARLDPDGSVEWFATDGISRTASGVVIGDDGTPLVTGSLGLTRPTAGRLLRLTPSAACGTRRVQRLDDGRLVASCYREGLFVQDGSAWVGYRSAEGGAYDHVYAVHGDGSGRLWVATAAGLLELVDGGLRRPAEVALRFERPVYSILEDPSRRLWFGTDLGVLRWDGRELDHFDHRDGLAGTETNRTATLVDRHGSLWFGTDRGVSHFDARHDLPPGPPPLVTLLEARAGERVFDPSAPVELGSSESDVVFRVRAISFADESRLRTRTRLDGYDDGWTEHSGSGVLEVRYTNLPPGSYRLHVGSTSADGVESAELRSAGVVVLKPVWATWWFRVLEFLAVCGLLLGAQRYLLHRTTARRLDREVKRRTIQLQRSEERAAAGRERLAAVLSSVADGVIATDPAGAVTVTNVVAERLLGLDEAGAAGLPLDRVLRLSTEAEPDRLLDTRTLLGLPCRRGAAHAAYVLHGRSDERRQVELHVSPLASHDDQAQGSRAGGYVLAIRDVTERRKTDERLARAARLTSLGVLAGGIAHDFNNVLTVASGNISLASAGGESVARYLRAADEALDRAADLARQLLTFSRGGQPLTRSHRLDAIVKPAVSLALSGSSVSCETELPDGLWPVEADASQLHQVFQNLLINARQAMPDGGTVTVRGENVTTADGTRLVRVTVHDEGTGIAPEDLARVFDPFYTTKRAGTGLGLSTTHSIVARHGGSIDVDSSPGAGTRFTIDLPASELLPAAGVDRASERAGTGTGRILVMDDEELVRGTLGSILSRLGYSVSLTSDGGEAVDAYLASRERDEPFDLLILDLTVPGGMGGLEALEHLQRVDPSVRAVASSGYAEGTVMANNAEFGFVDTLPKPYRLDDVAEVIGRSLDPAASRQPSARLR